MNWSDEQYTKIYKRETLTMLSLDWDARSVLRALLLKLDGAGVMETGTLDPAEAVALQLRAPVDVVRRALPALIACGTVITVRHGILVPNYVAAQEATKTERLKKADQRQREADQRRLAEHIDSVEADVPRSPAVSRAVPLQPSPAQLSSAHHHHQLSPPSAQEGSRPKKAKKLKGQGDLPGVPPSPPPALKPPTRIGKLHAFFLEERSFRLTDEPPDGLGFPEAEPDQAPNWGLSAATLTSWCALFPTEPEAEQDRLIKGMIRLWLLEPYWASPVDKKTGQPSTPYPWGAFLTEGQWRKAFDKLTGDDSKAGAA